MAHQGNYKIPEKAKGIVQKNTIHGNRRNKFGRCVEIQAIQIHAAVL